MESLALFVVILLIILALAGPLAYKLSKYKPNNIILKSLKRLIQGFMLIAGAGVAGVFLFSGMPLLLRGMGLAVEIIVYLAIRREYFPNFKISRKIMEVFSDKEEAVGPGGQVEPGEPVEPGDFAG